MLELQETNIKNMIYTIRGQQVMLDFELAEIYGYTTKAFNQQVKNNIEKFDDDFRFQLTKEEFENLRSKKLTSSWGGTRYMPYVFTEQGVYMLMTVLKGDLAVKQSKMLIRMFKEMKDFIVENNELIGTNKFTRIISQTNKNSNDIAKINENIINIKNDIYKIMDNFIDETKIKEFMFVDGQKFEADEAYIQLYKLAKNNIYVVDNYVSIKTLSHLKHKDVGVNVILFTDNKSKRDKLQQVEVTDFNNEYPLLEVRETNGMVHDRLIVIDYGTNDEKIYLCGASSKDAGAKFCTILEVHDTSNYHAVIDRLLLNNLLVI